MQIAKALGATVTGVCSTGNLDLVRSIGADDVIDYTREDFAQKGERFYLIFDVAAKRSFSDCKGALESGGIYVTTEFSPALVLGGWWASISGDKKLVPHLAKQPKETDWAFTQGLLESGQMKPVIDKRYALSETPEALRYLGEGHARGKVVIAMG